ncbi:16S rRNA (cytidine(1402)-2'-O)-methyltransferase [Buchnera aphidicola]|uniref:16S rRNA (cytidine(1402)-2'-O)-methyltransferase n=1 Tax=Buchnera aphidicola TaxID=9 RepID=UPI0034647660
MNQKYNGTLYVIATPIGNLQDISIRAINTLQKVDLIAAENIQHTKNLLRNFKINKKIISLHIHNENQKIPQLIEILKKKKIALVSNAGTPTINDPGYQLVKMCHKNHIIIHPIPGPCAAISALSASGISNKKFCYEGFIPKKKTERINFLKKISKKSKTTILYESCHRILKTMQDIDLIIGNKKNIVIAKEITKKWEKIKYGKPIEILSWLKNDKYGEKGEIVIIIEGEKKKKKIFSSKIFNTFLILKQELSTKTSIKLTASIYKINKNDLYKFIIKNMTNN